MLRCEVRIPNNKCIFGVIYIPSNSTVSFWDKLQYNVDPEKATNSNNILIFGDINADLRTPTYSKLNHVIASNFLSLVQVQNIYSR